MMGVYIKGTEMPMNCCRCPCADLEYYDCNLMPGTGISSDRKSGKRRDDCPLVPVPPHGDLIDRDKFRRTMFIGEQCLYSWDEIEDAIDFAPTIIPASEEGE